MTNLDKAITILLKKHETCDSACPELFLVKELQKARNAVKSILKSQHVLLSTTDIRTLAKDLQIDL